MATLLHLLGLTGFTARQNFPALSIQHTPHHHEASGNSTFNFLVQDPPTDYKALGVFNFKMPREAEPSLNEKAFVLQAIEEKQRIDGRGFEEYRPLELNFGDEHGVADVQLGKTR